MIQELPEVFAATIALFFFINLVFILINDRLWISFVTKLYNNSRIIAILAAAWGIFILFLLLDRISIVEVYLGMFLMRLFLFIGGSSEPYYFIAFLKKIIRNDFSIEEWFEVFLWSILSIAVLYHLFTK